MRVFVWPAGIALASAGALAAGLVGDGAWDVPAWVGLAVPVVAALPALGRVRRRERVRTAAIR